MAVRQHPAVRNMTSTLPFNLTIVQFLEAVLAQALVVQIVLRSKLSLKMILKCDWS